MPRRKKTAKDMTTEELAKRLFPSPLRKRLKEIAHEKDDVPEKPEHRSSQDKSST